MFPCLTMLIVASENAESVVSMAYAGPWFCTCVARLLTQPHLCYRCGWVTLPNLDTVKLMLIAKADCEVDP